MARWPSAARRPADAAARCVHGPALLLGAADPELVVQWHLHGFLHLHPRPTAGVNNAIIPTLLYPPPPSPTLYRGVQ